MEVAVKRTTRRIGYALAAAAAILWADTASAQGLFDFFRRSAPQVNSYADPFRNGDEGPRRESGGSYASHCVRLCDGRHFPLPRGVSNAGQLCQQLCPASATKIFQGSGIDGASSSDGKRYADLDNAYLYRDKVVDGCTCNGKSPMGLAHVDAKADPTLRQGDIVATSDGLMAYQSGKRSAEFTPIDRSILSKEWRSKLSILQVAPVPEEAPSDADLPKAERLRGQVSR